MWPTIWTIGHSVRPIDEFTTALDAYDIELVADVRRFPGSRRLPHYSAPTLDAALRERGVSYKWLEALGGRRRADPMSPANAWRHPAFRAYADYIQTEEFAEGLFELLMLAQGLRTGERAPDVRSTRWLILHASRVARVAKPTGSSQLLGMAERPRLTRSKDRMLAGVCESRFRIDDYRRH
jgi:hypothetical protein